MTTRPLTAGKTASPSRGPLRATIQGRPLLLLAITGILACEQPTLAAHHIGVPESTPSFVTLVSPIADATMGDFSPLARHLIAGLRDSALRSDLAVAMKDTTAMGSGVDLQDCSKASIAQRLLTMGEKNGLGSANQLCAKLSALDGAILYMDPQRLQAWNGKSIPIVTAIRDLNAPFPDSLVGYRSTSRSISFSSARPEDGPILIVLPYVHPRRAKTKVPTTSTQMIHVVVPTTPSPVSP